MEMKELPINKIVPNHLQPREVFDKEKLKELAATIADVGILQPILVRPKDDNYEIIAGERRWKATQIAGLKTIPALIKELPDSQVMVESLIENVHRSNLKPMEQAKAILEVFKASNQGNARYLIDNKLPNKIKSIYNKSIGQYSNNNLTEEEIVLDDVVKKVGLSIMVVYQSLKLLSLPESIQIKATEKGIDKKHLVSISSVESEEDQQQVFDVVVEKELSSRETAALTKVVNRSPDPVKRAVLDATVPVDVAQTIIDTKMVDKDQEKMVKIAVDKKLSKEGTEQLVGVVKASPEPVKRAVLNGKMDPEVAKEITTAFEDLPDEGMEQITIEAVKMKKHSPEYIKMHIQERKKQAEGRGVPEIKKGRNIHESYANDIVEKCQDVRHFLMGTVLEMPRIHQDRSIAAILEAHRHLEVYIQLLHNHDVLTDEAIEDHRAGCALQLTEGTSIPKPESEIDGIEFTDVEYKEV